MLNTIRYKLATKLAKRSAELIEKGDFKNIKKGMRYFKASVMIVPTSKELSDFGRQLKGVAEEHQKKLKDQG